MNTMKRHDFLKLAGLGIGMAMFKCALPAEEIAKTSGQMPLPADIPTVAEILKTAGYATACTGKWGLGMFDTSGSPLKKGFGHFYGYNCQRQAHSYFPFLCNHIAARQLRDR